MKKTMLVIGLLTLGFVSSARADYNLAADEGKRVTCHDDSNSTYVLSAYHKSLFVHFGGDPARGDVYKVTRTQTDGDTYKTFESIAGSLRLDDQGDVWVVGSDEFTLNCK